MLRGTDPFSEQWWGKGVPAPKPSFAEVTTTSSFSTGAEDPRPGSQSLVLSAPECNVLVCLKPCDPQLVTSLKETQ